MKGKRCFTEKKIRILREADVTGRKVQDNCCERMITEQKFHRLKREFGMLGVYLTSWN